MQASNAPAKILGLLCQIFKWNATFYERIE